MDIFVENSGPVMEVLIRLMQVRLQVFGRMPEQILVGPWVYQAFRREARVPDDVPYTALHSVPVVEQKEEGWWKGLKAER